MQVGDLVRLRPKNIVQPAQDFTGLVVKMQHVGRSKLDGTWLYDVLINEINEVLTISDIYFDIWRIDDQR